ncbi:MAG: DTW domain-containing protein [Candidatus Delongbacteria bacterium]|jgi:DTW domain-containing protein YfiP|nr:DTW domain-containing protein [Candidatus Delongbacteria bacterium]
MRKYTQNISDYCPVCKLYNDICICSEIKIFNLNTRVSILMHNKEKRKVSNTAKIAYLSLSNCNLVIKGEKGSSNDFSRLISSEYTNLVLYPDSSKELNAELVNSFDKPINLIALDGNYNQAGKMFRSEPVLQNAVKVRLPYGQIRKDKLRLPLHPEQISTIEAIINSLEIIGDTKANEHMEYLFNEMTQRLKKRVHG